MSEQTSFLTKSFVEQQQDRLIADLKEYPFDKRPTILKNKNNKWRVSSAMQKAIRRGDVEMALRTASAIHGLEPDYVWRRLCTVVIEEVGVADLELCARYLWVATNRVWRNKHGGSLQYLYLLVQQMCEAAKDRNACDLPVIGLIDPRLAEHRAATRDVTGEDLASIVADNEVSAENRALCAQYLCHWEHPKFPKSEGKQLFFDALRQAGFDDFMLELTKMGMTKQYEMQYLGIPFIWQMVQRAEANGTLSIEPDNLTDLGLVAGLPSEAFDRHNQEGKRALAYFFAACEPVRETFHKEMGESKHECLNALGAVLFRVEGHQVDRRLVYPESKEIDRVATKGDLWYNGVKPESQQALLDVVTEHLDDLHKARLKVVSPTP